MASLTEPDNSNPLELTARDLSRITKSIPCGDKNFQQHFLFEGLRLDVCDFKSIEYDKKESKPVRSLYYILLCNLSYLSIPALN